MKRILALTLAVLMIAALFCACGEKKKTEGGSNSGSGDSGSASSVIEKEVTAEVDKKYDDGFAEKYAKSVSTDDDGNKVYEFDGNAYENYAHDYNNKISKDMSNELAEAHEEAYGQFCYINDEKKAVIVGLNPGEYDEKVAAKEAQTLSKNAMSYFQGLQEKVEKFSVIFCNANNQNEVYGSFEFDLK